MIRGKLIQTRHAGLAAIAKPFGGKMKLTSQTNYALRMLMFCASKNDLANIREIAAFYQLPVSFLFKILNNLTACGLVKTVRGRNGGIRLAQPADKMKLGTIIRRIEDNFDMAECFKKDETTCPLVGTCGLNHALSRALSAFFEVLDEYTIADLTNNEHNINVLLELNAAMQVPFEKHESR